MSRSYKKNGVYTEQYKGKKGTKRLASKAVRRDDDIPSGGSYKKKYNSYNITDFRWFSNDPKSKRK